MKTRLLKRLRKEVKKYVYLQCKSYSFHCDTTKTSTVEIVVDNSDLVCLDFPCGKYFVSDCRVEYVLSRYGNAVPTCVKQDGKLHLEDCESISKEFELGSEEAMKILQRFRRQFILSMIQQMKYERAVKRANKMKVVDKRNKESLNKQLREI